MPYQRQRRMQPETLIQSLLILTSGRGRAAHCCLPALTGGGRSFLRRAAGECGVVGDALPFTRSWRTVFVHPNRGGYAPVSRLPNTRRWFRCG